MRYRLDEQRIALATIGGAVAVFLALFAVAGPVYQTPDEAKYIGLGLNILEGRGLVTDFGVQILYHAPVWPLVLAIPKAWFGIDPLAVGHVVNALSGAAAIVFAAALAWRHRPVAGAVTAAALLATPYLASLARTAGIDLPATALGLAYIWTALVAIDRGSVRLGLLAGLLFGVGFLIKETVIPLAPVPFLAAFMGTASGGAIARVAAAALLTAALTSGWWFLLYAQITGRVYRLGGPAWLLVPLGVLLAVSVAAGLLQSRLAATRAARALGGRIRSQFNARLRTLAAWGGLAGWLAVQLALYAVVPKLDGESIIRASQLLDDLRVYTPQIGMIAAFGLVGGFLAVTVAPSQPVRELVFAAVGQAALIVLVLGIGETPRHYIATICLGAALGAVGFTAATERAIAGSGRWLLGGAVATVLVAGAAQLLRSRELTFSGPRILAVGIGIILAVGFVRWLFLRFEGPAAGSCGRIGPRRLGAIALGALFLASATLATVGAARSSADENAVPRARAVHEIGDWLRTNVGRGETVTIGQALAYELALEVHGEIRIVRVHPEHARAEPVNPTGLRLSISGGLVPLTLEAARHDVDSLDAYESTSLAKRLLDERAVLWIEAAYHSPGETSTPLSVALTDATGTELVMGWSYPIGSRVLVVYAFRLDTANLRFKDGVTYAEAAAIEGLVDMLRRGNASQAAALFVDRIVPVPPGEDAAAAIRRLRMIAGS